MKIAIACFLGAFFGTITALTAPLVLTEDLIQPTFWSVMLGMIVGGLVGYLSYEPKKVWSAVKRVWGEILVGLCLVGIALAVALLLMPVMDRVMSNLFDMLDHYLPPPTSELYFSIMKKIFMVEMVLLTIGLIFLIPRMFRDMFKLFRLIHSDIRLLCMTDAAIGAAIGSYYGNPFIGGISGAILGVLNYELVSVRWLKLIPAK